MNKWIICQAQTQYRYNNNREEAALNPSQYKSKQTNQYTKTNLKGTLTLKNMPFKMNIYVK